ncbi:MAG TPA: sigma-54 dependent transcriptional regulator [Vicinamibacterales bacterium]|nr:sigma-54 dependent transcriptional regulator [Vicinamibacterales bacterium]
MSKAQPSILVVEDEANLRQLIADYLESEGLAVAQADTAAEARARLEGFAYDGLVIDLGLPDADGMSILDDAMRRFPGIHAVVITGFGGVQQAVQAIKQGATDFLTKPFQLAQLAQVLRSALQDDQAPAADPGAATTRRDSMDFHEIIGQSEPMKSVYTTLSLVAPMISTVLIQGETGTGKELIARTIHMNSPRRQQPFVAFNAAAIPDGLAEAELFGHVKGAFTGAVQNRTGRFELAHRGTLFIDEVASMSLPLQAKLLRALQERQIERVGDSRPIKFDIRFIAATNVDLKKLVRDGSFREDLFYRLNVVPVTLPPLRSRRDDIPLLAQHFLQKSCAANGVPVRPLAQQTLRTLMQHSWPGNIREFENAVEFAVAMSGNEPEIGEVALPEEVRRGGELTGMASVTSIPDEGINFTSVVSQLERELIVRCLEKTGGNKRQAARLLNLSRTTLIDKLQRLGGVSAA